MKKIFSLLAKLLLWAMTLFYLLFSVVGYGSGGKLAATMFVIAAILVIPIKFLRDLFRNILEMKIGMAIFLSVILFFVGVFAMPMDEEQQTIMPSDITIDEGMVQPTEDPALIDEALENTDSYISTFSVTYLDVGQGDAALVECDGHYMLIDGGTSKYSDKIYSYLKNNNIECLDYIVASHLHDDHIGGLSGALNYSRVNVVLSPIVEYESEAFSDLLKYLDENGTSISVPEVGANYELGSSLITVLAVNSAEENDASIVLNISYGDTDFMFTGDAESVTEEKMMSGLNSVQTDVLKVAHHGALTSTSQMFLENTGAKYAVISVGKDNSYGHPSAEVLNLLKQYGVAVFRTDIQGDILCVSDGVNIQFEVERNADADTFAAPKVEPSPTPTQIPQIEKIDEMDYVLNKNSQKFHYPSCGSVAKMKEKNKTYFTGAREELIKRGYEPCGNCMP